MRGRLLVLMGVSGAGKSYVGQWLSEVTGLRFIEGDDHHPSANREKMAAGVALTDDDRWPWLDALAQAGNEGDAIMSCSALKRAYRDRLRQRIGQELCFALLDAHRAELERRLDMRAGHFMPQTLLDSQLADLQRPETNEANMMVLSATLPLDQILAELQDHDFLPLNAPDARSPSRR